MECVGAPLSPSVLSLSRRTAEKMTPMELAAHWKEQFMSRFRDVADPDFAFMQNALGPAPPTPSPDFDLPTIFLSMEGVLLCKEWAVRVGDVSPIRRHCMLRRCYLVVLPCRRGRGVGVVTGEVTCGTGVVVTFLTFATCRIGGMTFERVVCVLWVAVTVPTPPPSASTARAT